MQREWADALAVYFPRDQGGIWRYNAEVPPDLVAQGFKIHVTSTVLNAPQNALLLGAFCKERDLFAKAAASLTLIKKLNCGLLYPYSQIGKVFTIYPQNDFHRHATDLVKLGLGDGPTIPFDRRVDQNAPIYYRFGSFLNSSKIVGANGDIIDDDRFSKKAVPSWIEDPFRGGAENDDKESVFATCPIYECIAQRGKGGVYRALDLSSHPPTRVIIKEGRRLGEINWAGRDGRGLVEAESRLLAKFGPGPFPKVARYIERFEASYLVMEEINGKNLWQELSMKRPWTRNQRRSLRFLLELCRGLATIHDKGFAWRDLKPQNILVRDVKPVLIDFEGAVRCEDDTCFEPWGSPTFTPPEWLRSNRASLQAQDLYALGKTIRMFYGGKRNRGDAMIPLGFRRTIRDCEQRNWTKRPKISRLISQIVMTMKAKPRRRIRSSGTTHGICFETGK
jgi:tRNA A-37 threonylcarbamoyl transferase component Bud32